MFGTENSKTNRFQKREHGVQKKLKEYKIFVLKYANRNMR